MKQLYIREERKILFVGDALIGDPPGRLRLLPEKMYADIQSTRDGIKTLMDLDFWYSTG